MIYEVTFRAPVAWTCPVAYIDTCACHAMISTDAKDIIEKSTGLVWKDQVNMGFCTEIVPYIVTGAIFLQNNPEEFNCLVNGGATVGEVLGFFEDILYAWDYVKESTPELADFFTFWVDEEG